MSEKERGLGVSLRASDEDRERLASALRTHAVAGRRQPMSSRSVCSRPMTLGALDVDGRDLPATPGSVALQRREHREHRGRRERDAKRRGRRRRRR